MNAPSIVKEWQNMTGYKIMLSNGVLVAVERGNRYGEIYWCSDWAQLTQDHAKGLLPDVSAVNHGPSTYGHVTYKVRP